MTSRHLVRRAGAGSLQPAGLAAGPADGAGSPYRRRSVVDEAGGAVHTGFGICELDPGGSAAAHVHSFEESFYLLEGEAVVETAEGAVLVRPGDYGVLPLGVAHAWSNPGSATARWADMLAPQPRARFGDDTLLVPAPKTIGEPVAVDVRDPRTRWFGHIEPADMDPTGQGLEQGAVSASMRTALLVYTSGGITVKMMVDTDLGALLSTMFMVQYPPRGFAGTHDHPFEETYLILDGEVDASFDSERYRLAAGDAAWAGVGCVHGFSNPADRPVRWLETQAPQPPSRHSYRFTRDWEYLRAALEGDGRSEGGWRSP